MRQPSKSGLKNVVSKMQENSCEGDFFFENIKDKSKLILIQPKFYYSRLLTIF